MTAQGWRTGIAALFGIWLAGSCPLAALQATAHETPARPVIEIVTEKENPSLQPGIVVARIAGPIAAPLAERLEAIRSELVPAVHTIIVDMDSPGGELGYSEKVAEILRGLREDVVLKTYVRHGSQCLSACVLLFAQGEERIAGGASSWLLHGVCHAYQSRPSPLLTQRFLDMLLEAGVSKGFVCGLVEEGYFTEPGGYWMSGYELYHLHEANIITRLLPSWQPSRPNTGPE